MTKRLIDTDDEALAEAAKIAGTNTYKDTVNVALRELVARTRRAEALVGLRELAANGGLDTEVLLTKQYRR